MVAGSTKATDPVSANRKASRDYTVLERYEAGVELRGTEVKSVRNGGVNLTGGFAVAENGRLILRGVHIPPYEHGNLFNHPGDRPRRLLLHKREMKSLIADMERKGLAVVPLKLYFKRGWVKIQLGLCKGKKAADKRAVLREKTANREAQRAIASRKG